MNLRGVSRVAVSKRETDMQVHMTAETAHMATSIRVNQRSRCAEVNSHWKKRAITTPVNTPSIAALSNVSLAQAPLGVDTPYEGVLEVLLRIL